ncbi:MAG: hypothetical protein HYX75_23330 [Acidobacteria bacterium]|nr:hypothetical protein [Acidobacteriota bacterium]
MRSLNQSNASEHRAVDSGALSTRHSEPGTPPRFPFALILVLLYSLAINTYAIWWGLPSTNDPGWAPDEIRPEAVITGIQARFSGDWSAKYPPTHFYILASVYRILYNGNELSAITESDYALLAIASRIVTVLMGAGIVLIVYLCGTMVVGRTAAVAASFLAASIAPLVYYSKTANVDVPYLFWFMVSLFYFSRIYEFPTLRNHLLFAATAMTSICTKDTAYALYILPAVCIFGLLLTEHRPRGRWRALLLALLDRRILFSVLLAMIVFLLLQNIAFNLEGFEGHVKRILGAGKEKSIVFDNTVRGHVEGLIQSVRNIRFSLGWASLAICTAGVIASSLRGHRNRALFWLSVPAVSCYLFMVSVLRSNFDRHLFPITITLTFYGGCAISLLLERNRALFRLRSLFVAAVMAYCVLYAVSVDFLMANDSRYYLREWIGEHAARPNRVVEIGRPLYLPGFRELEWRKVGRDLTKIKNARIDYVVMNTSDIRSTREEKIFAALESGKLGFRRLDVQEPTPPLQLLNFDRVSSNLTKISPPLALFERVRKAAPKKRD